MKEKFKSLVPMGGVVLFLVLLGGSVFVLQNSKNIFKSRAADQDSDPQNVVLSNVSEQGFTISYLTAAANSGTVIYGADPAALNQTAIDVQGASVSAKIHYVNVVTDLTKKTYYKVRCGSCDNPNIYGIVPGQSIGSENSFVLGSLTAGGGALDITAPVISLASGRNPTPVYGSWMFGPLLNRYRLGSGSIVYVFYNLNGSQNFSGMLSTFTKNDKFSLDFYNTRTSDYLGYMGLPASGSNIQVNVYGDTPDGFVSGNLTVDVLSSSSFQPLTSTTLNAYSLPAIATKPVTIPPPSPYATSSGLLAHWPMNEASWSGALGEIKDSAGTNNGTAMNGTNVTAGKFGNSANLLGSTTKSYVNLTDLDINSDFSVSAWIKTATSSADFPIIFKGHPGGGNHNFGFEVSRRGTYTVHSHASNCYDWAGGDSSGQWGGTVGSWNLFTATYQKSSGLYTFYTNGDPAGTFTGATSLCQNGDTTKIGVSTDSGIGGEYYATGQIDDVRIYDHVLSATEVKNLYSLVP